MKFSKGEIIELLIGGFWFLVVVAFLNFCINEVLEINRSMLK